MSPYLSDVVQVVDLRRQSSVDAEELLVHERGQREAVERLHASVVHALGVLDLACKEMKYVKRGFFVNLLKKRSV